MKKSLLTLCLCLTNLSCAHAAMDIATIGSAETVFNYRTDRCNLNDFPDVAAHAFIDGNRQVQLLATNSNGAYRRIGSTLGTVKRDCQNVLMKSHPNVDSVGPQTFYNNIWLSFPWYDVTTGNIYMGVHNEFHGWQVEPDLFCIKPNIKT